MEDKMAEREWGCECAKKGMTAVADCATDILRGKDLGKKVEIVETIKNETWSRMRGFESVGDDAAIEGFDQA